MNLISKKKLEEKVEETPIEDFGFEIHPKCKFCNSTHKLQLDKMILDGVAPKRIVDFCLVIDPGNNKQRIAGTAENILRNIYSHKKHIAIDNSKIEEIQNESMVLYKRRVQGEVSLGVAKKIATERMIDELNNDENDFTLQDLAVPINLEQRERSVKVEEGTLQINFAKFVKSNENGQVSGNEVESLEDSIRELNSRITSIGEEIRSIEGPKETIRS